MWKNSLSSVPYVSLAVRFLPDAPGVLILSAGVGHFSNSRCCDNCNEQDFWGVQSSSEMHRCLFVLFFIFSLRSYCSFGGVSSLCSEHHLHLEIALNVIHYNIVNFEHLTPTQTHTHIKLCIQSHSHICAHMQLKLLKGI